MCPHAVTVRGDGATRDVQPGPPALLGAKRQTRAQSNRLITHQGEQAVAPTLPGESCKQAPRESSKARRDSQTLISTASPLPAPAQHSTRTGALPAKAGGEQAQSVSQFPLGRVQHPLFPRSSTCSVTQTDRQTRVDRQTGLSSTR